jgi:N-acylneuraminate cytidylyltransferase/CMP-N,N'-diacetyllegionaminic acid synthase
MIVGIITARGGSKALPRKNVRLLAGKPLIAWTILAAKQSTTLQRILVSTDDAEIAEASRQWGAEVPFVRPAYLAQDLSSHIDVVIHAIEWLEQAELVVPDYIMLLQPTVPLRSANDIDAAVRIAYKTKADSVVSVYPCERHPFLAKQIDADGRLSDFVFRIESDLPRQTLPPAYSLNGAIYLIKPQVLKERHSWYSENTYAYVMPTERSADIDSDWDFYVTDLILRDQMNHENHQDC